MHIIDADNVISRALTLYGEWATDEIYLLAQIITPGMCILDAGAFIGTHTLAFSEFTGVTGKVYSFEPRKEIYAILLENLALNDRKNVTALNMGLAEKEQILNLQSLDIGQRINFGGLALDANDNTLDSGNYQVRVSTIDDFLFEKLDVIKLDVEGMERKVLDGATKIVSRDRPIIFCECNSLIGGSEIFAYCQITQYDVFGFLGSAYNPNNLNAIKDNIFGDAKELALVLIPREKIAEVFGRIAGFKLFPINDLEDLVLPLLYKPQYAYEVLAHTAPCSSLGIHFPSPSVAERDGQIVSLNEAIVQRDGQIVCLNEAIDQRDGQVVSLNEAIVQRDMQIVSLNEAIVQRDVQIVSLNEAIVQRDVQIKDMQLRESSSQALSDELRKENLAYRLSTSWRITKPLRVISQNGQRFMQLVRVRQDYQQKYSGFVGFRRLAFQCVDAIRNGGVKSLRDGTVVDERIAYIAPMSAEAVAQKFGAHRIDLLQTHLEKGLAVNSTILFDHNGGGGSNLYTNELVKIIHADGGMVLRVYFFEAAWFVQLITDDNVMLFYTSSIEKLFSILSASSSLCIVLNSLYGYPNIKEAALCIVRLARLLGASLDFKIHDFYALCPSPHLSNYEGKYCGVPQDPEVCKNCLGKNLSWYHDWYPAENRPIDINEWRKPFAMLLDAAKLVTFFDPSSVEIVRKAFYLDDGKIKVIPHANNYFTCDIALDVTGPLHIGILGTLSYTKGATIVSALYDYIEEQDDHIPITLVGSSYVDTPIGVKVLGSYTPNELPSIIECQGINVVLMPSIVPETFSYTISEAMKMELPIVAFDIGAQGNRVKQYRFGKVIPLGSSPKLILSTIQSALVAAQEFRSNAGLYFNHKKLPSQGAGSGEVG